MYLLRTYPPVLRVGRPGGYIIFISRKKSISKFPDRLDEEQFDLVVNFCIQVDLPFLE